MIWLTFVKDNQSTTQKSTKLSEPHLRNSNLENPTFFNLNPEADLNKLPKHTLVEVPSDDEDRAMCQQGKRQPKYKKVKSLGNFCQQFIHLFVGWKAVISLEEAARQITDDEAINDKALKTKIRRLYDIANVLQSIGLIEKTHMSTNRKPAFRWVGMEGVHSALQEIKNVVRGREAGLALYTKPALIKKSKGTPKKLHNFQEPEMTRKFKRSTPFQFIDPENQESKPSTAMQSSEISPNVQAVPRIDISGLREKWQFDTRPFS